MAVAYPISKKLVYENEQGISTTAFGEEYPLMHSYQVNRSGSQRALLPLHDK
jgi:hypothetical protein